jgi:putative membrane protein
MMMWYGGNWGWGAWSLMTVGMVAFWALVITAVVLVVRYLVAPDGAGAAPLGRKSAEDLLAERYARGEIDADEYRQRVALVSGRPASGGS